MSKESVELLKRALGLNPDERAKLADSLIESLDEAQDPSVQAAWDTEVLRRIEELESGRTKPVSLAEARRRLSAASE